VLANLVIMVGRTLYFHNSPMLTYSQQWWPSCSFMCNLGFISAAPSEKALVFFIWSYVKLCTAKKKEIKPHTSFRTFQCSFLYSLGSIRSVVSEKKAFAIFLIYIHIRSMLNYVQQWWSSWVEGCNNFLKKSHKVYLSWFNLSKLFLLSFSFYGVLLKL
jgi:hypothetical protein